MTAMAFSPKTSYAEELAQIVAKLSAAPELSTLLHTASFQIRHLLGCSVVIFTRPGSDPVYVASSNIGVPRDDLLHTRYERPHELLTRLDTGDVVQEGELPPRAV